MLIEPVCTGKKCNRKYSCYRPYLYKRIPQHNITNNIVTFVNIDECLSINLLGGKVNKSEYSWFLPIPKDLDI